MALASGTRLGPYEIVAPIGAGGMGEVYRAADTRLKRSVAIKVLPAGVAQDADRLARFQREAEVLAQLNHPNIAQIYGVETADAAAGQAGVYALVMELVEGSTLADRIAHGPIPIDEALPIAKQIAEALEAAHEQGIIHRDLKPANIKVREDGTVKVLDFGLAKAMDPVGAAAPANVSQLPTITTPAMMTQAGAILGTAAYMSPEQARGKPVDKRTDVWAFGCVLFEMLTGQRAFGGEDVADTLGNVLKAEPDWAALPPLAPTLRALVHRCLEKDQRQRIGNISTALFALDEAAERTSIESARTPAEPGRLVRTMSSKFAFAAVALLVGAGLAGGVTWLLARPAESRISRFEVGGDPGVASRFNGLDRDLAITPDGEAVVYRESAEQRQIFVRHLSALESVSVLSGLTEPRGLFMSPDGEWIGFFDGPNGGLLKRVSISGGPALTITSTDGSARGAVWLPDGTIVFATANPETGLQQVADTGGPVTVLTRPNRDTGELDHLWPESLRDGDAVLYTVKPETGGVAGSQIAVFDRQTGSTAVVARGGTHAHYVSTGHLMYAAQGVLHAMAFDADTLASRDAPVPVVTGVAVTPDGGMDAVVAANGTLVYLAREGGALAQRQMVWIDRSGKEEAIAAELRQYQHPRISPDGARLAIDTGAEAGIWIWDFARAVASRLTTDPTLGPFRAYPVWSPDGRTITFTSDPQGARNIFRQAADGSGAVERLTTSPNFQHPYSVTPDGTLVILKEVRNGFSGVYTVDAAGGGQPTPVLVGSFDYPVVDLSPDGKWIAVQSNESGRYEVYVRPFPDVTSGRWQVSADGGTFPAWARSGRELFYLATDGSLMSVPIAAAPSLIAGRPVPVVKPGYWVGTGTTGRPYDVSPDGTRFLMLKPVAERESADRIVVVENWTEELKRLVPVN